MHWVVIFNFFITLDLHTPHFEKTSTSSIPEGLAVYKKNPRMIHGNTEGQ